MVDHPPSLPPAVPVALLTGFLGSGKTTLLNALLRRPDFANTAVIVNEFGAVGLDHMLVAPAADGVVLLEGGCLCCTITNSLRETLADLWFRRVRTELPPFARVIVETSGLADPAPLLHTLLADAIVTDHYALDGVIATVDALHGADALARHPDAAKQVAVADRIVVTKGDLAPADALTARIRALNARAPILTARCGDVAAAALFPMARDPLAPPPADDGAPRHAHAVRADTVTPAAPVSWAGLAAWTELAREALGERLLRCKGVLRNLETGRPVVVQGVQRVFAKPAFLDDAGRWDGQSRLVCITRDVPRAELDATLPALRLPAGSERPARIRDLMEAS